MINMVINLIKFHFFTREFLYSEISLTILMISIYKINFILLKFFIIRYIVIKSVTWGSSSRTCLLHLAMSTTQLLQVKCSQTIAEGTNWSLSSHVHLWPRWKAFGTIVVPRQLILSVNKGSCLGLGYHRVATSPISLANFHAAKTPLLLLKMFCPYKLYGIGEPYSSKSTTNAF